MKVTAVPVQIEIPGEALMLIAGVDAEEGITVTLAVSVNTHELLDELTVYVVVTVGVAIGLAIFGLLSELPGDQV